MNLTVKNRQIKKFTLKRFNREKKSMSNIGSTRRGYLYQDRFAVLTYLREFQNKNIQEFYIDYPLKGKKSLDILHIDKNRNEIIYEVKSGEIFKESSDEIKIAIINLKEQTDQYSNRKAKLIIRSGFKKDIAKCWTAIVAIKEKRGIKGAKSDLVILRSILKIEENISEESLFKTIKKIHLEDGDDDVFDNTIGSCKIDQQIISQIQNIARFFEVEHWDYEYPAQLLMYQLHHLCCRDATTDIHPKFFEAIKCFLINRKYLEAHHKRKRNPIKERNKIKENIEKLLESFGYLPSSNSETSVLSRISEGIVLRDEL